MDFLEPWFAVDDRRLVDELLRELPPGHVLAGLSVAVRARRQDRDDVLFNVLDGSGRLARVHLTYRAESDPRWPLTTLFSKEAEFSAFQRRWAQTMRTTKHEWQGRRPARSCRSRTSGVSGGIGPTVEG